MNFYAHTATNTDGSPADPSQWEPLFTPFGKTTDNPAEFCSGQNAKPCPHCENLAPNHGHLNKVAHLAAKFAAEMFPESPDREAAKQWGYLAGLWHDLGKFSTDFQKYLENAGDPHMGESQHKVDHSTAGAQHSRESIEWFGTLLSYTIAGHHAGLTNGIDSSDSSLRSRLHKVIPDTPATPPEIVSYLTKLPPPPCAFTSSSSVAHFTRMIFSCLVDADFLATEAFMAPEKKNLRAKPDHFHPLESLDSALAKHIADFGSPTTRVNQLRADILRHCLNAAPLPPGLFSLTVPTGGGKTLASLSFAIKHAQENNLHRIIYVIPFTSIIEQNASVFREVFASLGDNIVLEHHSNLDPDSNHQTTTSRLSTENWDAQLIVTTNVQFFESLHANRTSRCRKLHRIARSVVIFDEVQALPTSFLSPCLRTIEELTQTYGVSAILCTATQPSLTKDTSFPIGLTSPREIISNPSELYRNLRRVSATVLPGKLSNEDLSARLVSHRQVLCIVNTRRHARELFDLLPADESRFHLSALMCPQHRTEILDKIKSRLQEGKSIRLVSTQLIEAGVDIDFPTVFRSVSGLDSIAQAAGRCDREGKLTATAESPAGQLFIFEPEHTLPAGHIRNTADTTKIVLADKPSDPLSLDCINAYFKSHYSSYSEELDACRILDCWPDLSTRPAHLSPQEAAKEALLGFSFKRCAEDFKLIDDYTDPIIIPHGPKGVSLCCQAEEIFDPHELRNLSRKLQRYTVAIPKSQHALLLNAGILKPLHDNRFFILNSNPHYDPHFGLHPHPDLMMSASNSIL